MVNGRDLPPISGENTYMNSAIPFVTLAVAFSQLGPFFGIFFGTKGPNNEWPYAWWSLCFFANFFGAFQWFGARQVYKVIRTSSELVFKNMYGGIIETIPVDNIE